jgi:hypothetical protein
MNRRGFLKFLSTATAAYALPAIGAAPALGVVLPGLYVGMRFEKPITAPPGSVFDRCWFSAAASGALPPDCTYFSCFFEGAIRLSGPGSSTCEISRFSRAFGNSYQEGIGYWQPGTRVKPGDLVLGKRSDA